jgi:eukaryotic-like serine/threonine-protein kinase
MSLISREFYRFDNFELQPSRRSLLRRGEKIALAPKTFEVLVCLVTHAGDVVLKEDLFKAVWPESFVEESNLTQHIFWIRKALADKADYVVTIPGRGYQFTAPVVVVSEEDARAEANAPVSTGLKFQHTTERTQIVFEEAATILVHRPSRRLGRRNAILLSTAAALVVAVLVSWFTWRRLHGPVPGDHHQVVLADFENTSGDPDFDRALKTLLVIDLNQSPFLIVAGGSDVRKVLKLMNRPPEADLTPAVAREVCERLNDQVVLAGTIARFGQKYLLTLTATDCSDGKDLIQTKQVAANRDDVIKAVDTMAADMRERLGEPLKSRHSSGQRLQMAHTFSLDALKAYSQALALHQKLKFKEAEPFYQRAIDLDPNFATAYDMLANCYNNMGEAELGNKAQAKAYELRDQADEPTRLRITAMYEYWKTGDRHQAVRNFQNWTTLYPNQPEAWDLLGEFQSSVGRMDLAIEAEKRGLVLAPNSTFISAELAYLEFLDGRIDDSKATIQAAFARGLDNSPLHETLFEIAYLQHDASALQQQMTWIHEKGGEDNWEHAQGDLDASQGKIHSAIAHWRRVADLQKDNGVESVLESFCNVPELEAELGNVKDARQHLEPYRPPMHLVGPCLSTLIVGAAEAGDLDLAQKKLHIMLDNGHQDSDVQEMFAPKGRAAIALAQGHPDQAIADMQPTSAYELTDWTIPDMRGRVLLAAGRGEMAQHEFQTIIDRPFISGVSPVVPMAHLSLARALEMQSNHDASRQEYETFFKLWKDADTDLPLLKQARLEYAKIH